MNSFSSFHPLIQAAYFVAAIGFTVVTSHPVFLVLSFLGAALFYSRLVEGSVWAKDLVFYFFLFLFVAVTNPVFSHNGKTILFFLNGNPFTLEAVWYGFAIGGMLVAVILWSKCLSLIMTTDRFLYLFGKPAPKLALIVTMALRFFPLLKRQMQAISRSQKAMGMYAGDSLTDRFLFQVRVVDSLLTWMLEQAVDTADSMKSRGYGLPGRTRFSIFRIQRRDRFFAFVVGVAAVVVAGLMVSGAGNFSFYPVVSKLQKDRLSFLAYAVAGLFFLLPFLVELWEMIVWRRVSASIGNVEGVNGRLAEAIMPKQNAIDRN